MRELQDPIAWKAAAVLLARALHAYDPREVRGALARAERVAAVSYDRSGFADIASAADEFLLATDYADDGTPLILVAKLEPVVIVFDSTTMTWRAHPMPPQSLVFDPDSGVVEFVRALDGSDWVRMVMPRTVAGISAEALHDVGGTARAVFDQRLRQHGWYIESWQPQPLSRTAP